ncbi:hypothetical protein E3P99_02461 [Wallemia hederae]|uniref:Major facilitator superfamily (MFS) profile domain-containing protein n=1 Tax=Wallemia hederae TaxID=1540922 RepID=A0A4T0FJH9_9BASI|nr:hypothetical protein E3P99_02461 [Wallemia hederae]
MTVDYSKHSVQASNSDSTVKVFFPDTETTSNLSVEKNKTVNKEYEPSHTNWAIKIVFICLAFAAIGINDSATGSNLHNIQDRYSITFNQTSFLFLSNAGGYAISSLCTCHIMFLLGVRITIFFSAIIYTAGALMMAFAPPFPVVVVSLFQQGIGSGFLDGAATSVLALIASSDVFSRVYSTFSFGSMIAPFIIGAFSQHNLTWHYFYFLPMSMGVVLLSGALFVFKGFTLPNERKAGTVNGGLKSVLSKPISCLALVLAFLTGSHQFINSQWSPSYFLYQGYEEDVSTYIVAGFWGGVAIGRLVGPTVFKKVHEKIRNLSLLIVTTALIGVIWGVDNLAVRAVCMGLSGLCWGPLNPAAMDVGIARVPQHEKPIISPIIIFSVLMGGSLSPFTFSFAADAFTAKILPGVLVVLAGVQLVLFAIVPRKS